MGLRVVQINLQHSRLATDNLSVFLVEEDADIALIQEPWVWNTEVKGLQMRNYNLFYKKTVGKPRSCIAVKSKYHAFLLPSHSSQDLTAARLETAGGTSIVIISCYMPHNDDAPPAAVHRAVSDFKGDNLVIGCDCNSRHSLWGSSEINTRGESLFDYILSTNLVVCNQGTTPTFTFPSTNTFSGWEEVLDITLSNNGSTRNRFQVENWKVADKKSFSDHRYILFDISAISNAPPPFRNPKRTNWRRFVSTVDSKLRKHNATEPTTFKEIESKCNKLANAMDSAFKVSCPMTFSRKQFPPWWSDEISKLRKKTRKLFNRSYSTGNWIPYKDSLREYKKAIRNAKQESWRDFCSSIECTKESSRISKILSKEHTNPSFLQKGNGQWTTSSKETLELLLDTHFPDCEPNPVPTAAIGGAALTTEDLKDIITREKIAWAISSFSPYKSPGPDGIIPAMLQEARELVIPWLESIFKACLRLNYVPTTWKNVKVVFIPKIGKRGPTTPKDFRPISLSSFILKTLERLVDFHIRSALGSSGLSTAQHAYLKGRSTESALHEVVHKVESSLENKHFTLAAFLDIEGAFNNVSLEAIEQSLWNLKTEKFVGNWISTVLRTRIVNAKLGSSVVIRHPRRGTPQGGVLSPLLWICVLNNILLRINKDGVKVVAYADDVVIMVSGLCINVVSGLLQRALRELSSWAGSCELNVNPLKTELLLFTNRKKIPSFNLPSLEGHTLSLSSSAKYLGVILTPKLNWKMNTEHRVKKAYGALYSCKKMLGKKWGLSPRLMSWMYQAVIRPIIVYGSLVWWPAVETNYINTMIGRIQRSACIAITGAIRSCPTEALNVICNMTPIDIFIKQSASHSAVRLKELSLWKERSYGHGRILHSFSDPNICLKSDYISTTLIFRKNFDTIFPSRKEWKAEVFAERFDISIYTDGSKMDCGVGAGVYSADLQIQKSFRLPNPTSVFQAEVFAIREACKIVLSSGRGRTKIAIFSDSQAAIKALGSVATTSNLIKQCREYVTTLAGRHIVALIWVPGHSSIRGNDMADELARNGSAMDISRAEEVLLPLSFIKSRISQHWHNAANDRWKNLQTCRVSRGLWPTYCAKRTSIAIKLDRKELSRLTAVYTGHWTLGAHAARLGLEYRTYCRSCNSPDEEETIEHFLCDCPALARTRMRCLGNHFFGGLTELKDIHPLQLLRYLNSTGWI